MNPLFQMMMQQHNPMLNMAKQFQQFRQNFNGNPQQMVQQLLQSGKVTKSQYESAVQMAQQLQGMLR